MIDISVCIPTYKRPQMLQQAIKSFREQSHKSTELVIVDDCSNDQTEEIATRAQKKDKRIVYEKNKVNLGYCKNFLKTLLKAKGKYLLLLGDDDLILNKDTLKRYVAEFEQNKKLGFIYSNIIQFNNNLSVDFIYNHFTKDISYKEGADAIKNIWLKSSFVGGIGLRNSMQLQRFFRKDNVLFPIVELVGKILLDNDALGIASYNVGMRVHDDQLGFHMMNKKRIVGRERHAYLELYEIADNISSYIKKEKKSISATAIKETVDAFLGNADKSIVFVEGTKVNKKILLSNTLQMIKQEKRIQHSPIFWLQIMILLFLPSALVKQLKESYRGLLRFLYWQREVQFFEQEKKRLSI